MGMTDAEMDAHDRLTSIIGTLADLPSTNVVLVGDIMMDRYIHGFADNLNTRAPVPVLKETRRESSVCHISALDKRRLPAHQFLSRLGG